MTKQAMKKTAYKTMVAAGLVDSKWQRVYKGEDGKLYIRKNGQYVCITGTPAESYMQED